MPQTITITVGEKIASTDFKEVVSFNSDYLLHFIFDGEWEEFSNRVAVAIWADGCAETHFEGSDCALPFISSPDAESVLVGVYATSETKKIASTFVRLRCRAGAHAVPAEKTSATLHEQILSFLNEKDWSVFKDKVAEGVYSAVRVNTKGLVVEGSQIIEVGEAGQESPASRLAEGGLFIRRRDDGCVEIRHLDKMGLALLTIAESRHALSADEAEHATNADNATYATTAGSATTADSATFATTAGKAEKAVRDNLGNEIDKIYATITQVASRASADDLEQEISDRQAADNALGDRIDDIVDGTTVVAKATTADSATFATTAGTAEKAVRDNLGNEIDKIYATITQVASRASAVDLEQEITDRQAADNALGDRIDGIVDGTTVVAKATTADSADEAEHATNADNATYATTAGSATTADSATTAGKAEKAVRDNLGNEIDKIYATITQVASRASADDLEQEISDRQAADNALGDRIDDIIDGTTVVAKATTADSADEAEHATNADNATYATTAGSATTADSATFATTAGTAQKAVRDNLGNEIDKIYATITQVASRASAVDLEQEISDRQTADSALSDRIDDIVDGTTAVAKATSADGATTAEHATSADNATYATSAGSATTAASANKVKNKFNVFQDGVLLASYDGSAQEVLDLPSGDGGTADKVSHTLTAKVNATTVTFDGSETVTIPTIFAANSGGTNGYYLRSNGSAVAPSWASLPITGKTGVKSVSGTSVTITHGLGVTPSEIFVHLKSPSNKGTNYYVTSAGSSSFTVSFYSSGTAAAQSITGSLYWFAIK